MCITCSHVHSRTQHFHINKNQANWDLTTSETTKLLLLELSIDFVINLLFAFGSRMPVLTRANLVHWFRQRVISLRLEEQTRRRLIRSVDSRLEVCHFYHSSILNKRPVEEVKGKLTETHFGFRKNRGIIDAVCVLSFVVDR